MIGYLSGKLISKNEESLQCVLLTDKIGYEVTLHKRFFEQARVDTDLSLWIHTQMKENAIAFYGFSSEQEKQLFRILLGVSGLGPKSALSLLGEHGSERLAKLILEKRASDISSAPGVGKKTAERIVLELKSKIEKLTWLDKVSAIPEAEVSAGTEGETTLKEDLSLALEHLGYQPSQFRNALDRYFAKEETESIGFEAGLKRLLAELSGRSQARTLGN